jgi:signal transduction histidine kinase
MQKHLVIGTDEEEVSSLMSQQKLRAEADQDLARRSLGGVFSYFALWLIIYYTSELERANEALLEFLGFMLGAAGVFGLYLAWKFEALYPSQPGLWRWLFATGTALAAAVWGGVSVLALNYDGLGTTSIMVMLSTAAIAAVAVVALAPARLLGGVVVLLLLLPVVPPALTSGSAPENGVALLFLAFFVFMLLMWRRLHTEYWRALAGRAELVVAKEAAEAATLAKGQFIASVSHELRTPLTSIIGSLGLIDAGISDEDLPEQSKKLINMAYENGKRLSVLINDILDFEKLEAGRMEFKYRWLALAPFLEEALELNDPYAESYNVSLELEEPLPDVEVHADEQRLMQVMSNLLSNAVKYSPAGEKVTISTQTGEGMVRIAVTDRGTGVPEEFRDRIFQKFSQAGTSNTRKTKGTGLGLVISKSIVEKMGGTIGYDSTEGQGATFYFDLPLAEPGETDSEAE